MIFKACVLALVVPLASATISLTMCPDPRSGSPCLIKWDSSDVADPASFSLELTNEVFHDTYAIGNNLGTSDKEKNITLPTVPVRAGYTLAAVDIGNITNIYATTGEFSVGAALSSSTSSSGTGTGARSTSSVAVTSQSSTSTGSSVGSVSSTSSSTGTTGTQTGSTNTATPSSFNGATAKHASGSYAALALSALGVVILAL